MQAVIRLALLICLLLLLALGAVLAAAPLVAPANRTLAALMGDCGLDCWHHIHIGDATADLRERLGVDLAFADCFNILSPDCGAQFDLKGTTQTEALRVIAARGVVKQVLARHPAITLGEALLSQGRATDLIYTVTPSATFQFRVYFGYAENSLTFSAVILCPASYADLLRQPLSAISLQAPTSTDAHPATFADLRRTFQMVCHS